MEWPLKGAAHRPVDPVFCCGTPVTFRNSNAASIANLPHDISIALQETTSNRDPQRKPPDDYDTIAKDINPDSDGGFMRPPCVFGVTSIGGTCAFPKAKPAQSLSFTQTDPAPTIGPRTS